MSVRPRPVTATIIPPELQPPVIPPTDFSLLSSGSTESLISVLNHDSYESCSNSGDEKADVTRTKKKCSPLRHRRKVSSAEKRSKSLPSSDASVPPHPLSTTWEEWVVRKGKEDHEKTKEKLRKKKQEERQAQIQKKEEEEKKKKTEEKVQQWLGKLAVREKTRSAMNRRNEQVKAELELQKKRETEEKASKKYQDWMNTKKEKVKEQKKQEQEQKQREEAEKLEKESKNKKAYEAWLEKSQSRPQSTPNSFGYTCGKLTGYHDKGAYPIPSFYNPIPWHPIAIPKEKTLKKKKTRSGPTRQWNPAKYL